MTRAINPVGSGVLMFVLAAAGRLLLPAAAAQGPLQQGAKEIDVEKVHDNLYVLRGKIPPKGILPNGGANTVVFITASGVVVVDTKYPGWGRPILDTIKTLTDKPVTTVINTNSHNDHTGSNAEFPASVEFVAHENTLTNLSRASCTGNTNCGGFKGENAKFLPKRTFKDKMSIGRGKDRIDLYHFGRARTNDDAFVVFPAARAMYAGDTFFFKMPIVIDAAAGGSGVDYPDTLAKALAGIKNVDTIITGHGALMTRRDLQEYADFNRDFLTMVREGQRAGKSVDELAAAYKVPERYKNYMAPATNVKNNIQVIYDELGK